MRKISKKQQRLLLRLSIILLATLAIIGVVMFLGSRHFAVLDPQGAIAVQQRNLLVFATVLSLVVIIPVYALTFHIVRTYRVDAKKKARYTPDWDHDRKLESLWWGVPSLIILVLSVVAWQSSHSLDPFKPIVSDKPPITIQVIAMQWKWLFIYPEQQLATVNYVQIPSNRPVNFQITSDAPMNSFWIPQLGGQIYAMSGMSTSLQLIADRPGIYQGSSANLSGAGFAGMKFKAQATTEEEFNLWAKIAQKSHDSFTATSYDDLAQPSSNTPPAVYSLGDKNIYNAVINKYMGNTEMHHAAN